MKSLFNKAIRCSGGSLSRSVSQKRRYSYYVLGIVFSMVTGAHAATIMQTEAHNTGESWDTASKWSNGAAPSTGNTYINDLGESTRTPSGGGTFGGDSLTLANGSALVLKNGGTFTSVDLIIEGGNDIVNGGGGTAKLRGTVSGVGTLLLNTGTSSRGLQLDALVASGNALTNISVVAGGTVTIANSGNNFTGVWDVQYGTLNGVGFGDGDFVVRDSGILNFDSSFFSTNAMLTVQSGGVILLDENITVHSVEILGETLAAGTYTGAQLKADPVYGAAFDASSSDLATITVTLGELGNALFIEAENMILSGYEVADNADASGGQIIQLSGAEGSAYGAVYGFNAGYFDLNVGCFDETDGSAAFKVYLNADLLDSWLADRRLGDSAPSSVNYMERDIRRVYLEPGDQIEVLGQGDGGELSCLDRISFAPSSETEPASSMSWNSDATIASLVLSGVEHLDSGETSSVELRSFSGYVVGGETQGEADRRGSVVELQETDDSFQNIILRMDAYEHHVALRLIDIEGIPKHDNSYAIQMEIPFLSTLGYQALDTNVALEVSGNTLQIDWTELGYRNLLAGGQVALYATADETAAQNEIAQIYTDNGKLDPYYDWVDGYPLSGTDSDLFADPDGDGLNNLSEYALGGNPALGEVGLTPTYGIENEQFTIQYNRRRDSNKRGLTYTVLTTEDLVDAEWTTQQVSEIDSIPINEEFERLTKAIPTSGKTNAFLTLDLEFDQ